MIVLAESNFVLELAFHQEESEDAQRIVDLARAKSIELVIPACALTEPYETLFRRRKERRAILDRLTNEINQLARSRDYTDLAETSKAVTEALTKSGDSDAKGLDDTIRLLLGCATIPELTRTIAESSLNVQIQWALQPQDAIVFASIEQHLRTLPQASPKLFINKNHRDFLKPDIEAHFQQFNCRLLPKLSSARQYLEHELAQSPRAIAPTAAPANEGGSGPATPAT